MLSYIYEYRYPINSHFWNCKRDCMLDYILINRTKKQRFGWKKPTVQFSWRTNRRWISYHGLVIVRSARSDKTQYPDFFVLWQWPAQRGLSSQLFYSPTGLYVGISESKLCLSIVNRRPLFPRSLVTDAPTSEKPRYRRYPL